MVSKIIKSKMKHTIFLITIIVIFYSCSDNQDKNKSVQASDSIQTTIPYEIINTEGNEIQLKMDVFVNDTSRIKELNEFFIKKYKTPNCSSLFISYFSNKKIAKIYFDLINKGSEKESERLFKYYVARYNYNAPTGYDNLSFMHDK